MVLNRLWSQTIYHYQITSCMCSEIGIWGSRLREWNLLQKDTKVCFFRNCQEEFQDFYSEENYLAYCNNICAVMDILDHEHTTTEWRLFIDSSKTSLKAVLLHNGNKFPSVPLAYATNMKETYENLKILLEKKSV